MSTSRHDFSERHPEAYCSFVESGWKNIQFADSSQSPVALIATNPNGQEVTINLPKRPGVTIPDSAMLDMLRQNGIRLRPLKVDLSSYAEGWGFNDSSKGPDWKEKIHRRIADEKAYLNVKAQFPEDILLIIEKAGRQIRAVKLKELNNLYMLGEYLDQKGYPGR